MDFMNLNQAAHGDREFAHVLTRMGAPRKTVAGHVSDPLVVDADRDVGARRRTGLAEIRSLKLARFGDNMRQVAVTEGDKVEAQMRFGVSVNTYGVNDLVAAVEAVADAEVDALVGEYEDSLRRRRPSCAAAASDTSRCATAHASSSACVRSSTPAGSARSPPTSRISAGCASCPDSPCSDSWPTATGSAPRATGRPR